MSVITRAREAAHLLWQSCSSRSSCLITSQPGNLRGSAVHCDPLLNQSWRWCGLTERREKKMSLQNRHGNFFGGKNPVLSASCSPHAALSLDVSTQWYHQIHLLYLYKSNIKITSRWGETCNCGLGRNIFREVFQSEGKDHGKKYNFLI